MNGAIHSIETFGTVDGPGTRFVIFLQGCPMRCLYCHNPDTWEMNAGTQMSAEELLDKFEDNRDFYKNGGITVTGGEPLVQIDFLLELFEKAKEKEIHTCIDTSGITYSAGSSPCKDKLDKLMNVTDLVMIDIKHINSEKHFDLTGHKNENILSFLSYLEEKQIDMWVRHVVVPGLTDDPESLRELGLFIGRFKHVKALDVLPYHNMGKVKYESLGMDYPLKDIPPTSKESAIAAKQIILDGIREVRTIL